jgi:hypothetical protein
MREMEEQKQAERFELPPYRVSISSPLQRNFLYVLVVGGALALGYAEAAWASILLYAAIGAAGAIAGFTILRDGIFLHLEGQRLEVDGDWINSHTHGPDRAGDAEEPEGFLKTFTRKKRTIFRSRLLQIHYQNVLRAFDQGARRAWVYQDASIAEIQTLLTQRGMKLAWNIIDFLPQLGLLGTLVGLMQMFLSFRVSVASPELNIVAGFATALGTTIAANFLVLLLRPLHMQNERSVNEILSTLQTLMAIFILPTQQYAMDRAAARAGLAAGQPGGYAAAPLVPTAAADQRISRTVEQLTATLKDYMAVQEKVDSGAMARETARVATEVQSALRSFQEAVHPDRLARQQQALAKLTESVQGLSGKLHHLEAALAKAPAAKSEPSERIEHDLTQLRVLTRDTLVLLGQIASRLSDAKDTNKGMLSLKAGLHAQVFPELRDQPVTGQAEPAPPAPAGEAAAGEEAVSGEFAAARPMPDQPRGRDRGRRPEVSAPKIRLVGERS